MSELENKKEEDVKFSLDMINQTFTRYKLNEVLDGVVVTKKDNGVIFNIGGKSDAYISKTDFLNFEEVKVGDRFKVVIVNMKNEEGMIEASKSKADELLEGTLEAKQLKLGSKFSFVVTKSLNQGLSAKLGEYSIFVPASEISKGAKINTYENKKIEALVTDINHQQKQIVASIKMLEERTIVNNEIAFWNSVFVNKLVSGVVESVAPFGAFVNVNGVVCLCHISDVSHDKIKSVNEVLKVGEKYTFRVTKVDKEAKKVSLSYKALQENEKSKLLKELVLGNEYKGKVTKLFPFGAIVKLDCGAEGLLHISEATSSPSVNINEIINVGDEIDVLVKNVDFDKERISLSLKNKL